jgi:peptidoglycan-associated lipoprotein
MKLAKYCLIFSMCVVFCFGCSKKPVLQQTDVEIPAEYMQTDADVIVEVEEVIVEEPSIRQNWVKDIRFDTIYFAFDSEELTEEAKNILRMNADVLLANPNLYVVVEGHCDERGTTEYNLALGQRRAMSVRQQYGRLGVPLERIATISYGEERPVDAGHNENAWNKNRRAETKVKEN